MKRVHAYNPQSGRPRRRRIHPDDRRREILIAALELAAGSWESVDINGTALKAGCSPELVRTYFRNRGVLCRAAAKLAQDLGTNRKIVERAQALDYL